MPHARSVVIWVVLRAAQKMTSHGADATQCTSAPRQQQPNAVEDAVRCGEVQRMACHRIASVGSRLLQRIAGAGCRTQVQAGCRPQRVLSQARALEEAAQAVTSPTRTARQLRRAEHGGDRATN